MEESVPLNVSVVGLGYIGLPTAAMFASRKIPVVGIDVNPAAVATINEGRVHIVEPDLDMVVHAAVTQGFLRAATVPEPADAFLIAVPTPLAGADHQPDVSFVERAARAIAPVLASGNLVVLESTSPIGTTEAMAAWLAEERPDLTFPQSQGEQSDIRIAYCPERVLPGKVMTELIHNDRIIGGMTAACSRRAVALYRLFVEGECFITNCRTAEMAKLTENSFRDVNIAFANELSVICDRLDINVWELIRLANRHPRVQILQPGPGVGGHCIAVDPWFIVSSAPEEARLIRAAREINDDKPQWVIDKVKQAMCAVAGNGEVTIACLGLAFKPDIDDLRESPALEICRALTELKSCRVVAVEPHVEDLPPILAGRAELAAIDEALAVAQVVVVLVDHKEFAGITPDALAGKQVVDTRGLLGKSAST